MEKRKEGKKRKKKEGHIGADVTNMCRYDSSGHMGTDVTHTLSCD